MRRVISSTVLSLALTSCAAPADDALPLLQAFAAEFVEITPGRENFPASYEMGSAEKASEQPVHRVTLQDDFAIAKYEVPQNLYEAVMGENPSRWKGPRNSAEMMTWSEAVSFCEKITRRLQAAKLMDADEVIRLPSEAEWEFCCRAGTTTSYSFGEAATADGDTGSAASLLDPYGWHAGNAAGNDPPVGALQPNPWGLYDMHGYLREFTADHWHADYNDAPDDGAPRTSLDENPQIVVRGGSWKDTYDDLRSASRQPFAVTARDDAVGFRCVKAKAR